MLSELVVKISADMQDFEKDIGSVQSKLDGFGTKMKSVGTTMSLAFTAPILAMGGASIKLASDMAETMNKIDVTFKENASVVKEWAKNSIEQMGLSQASALDATALFGDFASSMGLTSKDTLDMSMSLTQLGADLASFKNVDIEQAMNALAGVFTGETESLKRLGVVMTEVNLETFALAQGIQKPIDKMSQAEKVQLRYAYLMNVTKNAQGDFARTADGSANQMRMFQENLKELGTTIGAIILPFFTSFITKLNDLVKFFTNLNPKTQKFLIILAGVVAVIGPLLIILGFIASAISSLIGLFVSLNVAMLPLLATIGLIILAIVAIGVAVFLIIKYWDEIKAFFIATWEKIKEIFFKGLDFISNLIKNSPIGIYFRVMFAIMERVIKAFLIIFLTLFTPIFEWLREKFNNLKEFFKLFWEANKLIFKIGVEKIKPVIQPLLDLVAKIKEIWGGLKEFFGGLFDSIGNGIKEGLNMAIRFVNKMIESVENSINKIIDSLNKMGEVFGISIDRVSFGRLSEIGSDTSSVSSNFNGGTTVNPNNSYTNVYIDGRQVASSVAPYMTDSVMMNNGVAYR